MTSVPYFVQVAGDQQLFGGRRVTSSPTTAKRKRTVHVWWGRHRENNADGPPCRVSTPSIQGSLSLQLPLDTLTLPAFQYIQYVTISSLNS